MGVNIKVCPFDNERTDFINLKVGARMEILVRLP